MKIVDSDCTMEGVPTPRPQTAAPRKQSIRLALPGVLLALACLVPFLNKAYTIDDPVFLLEGRQILKSPLQPMSFGMCWMENETCVARMGQWPSVRAEGLMGYLLAPVILAGGAEWIAHSLQAFLACLAVLVMVRLALRLGFDRVQAAIAGLLVAAIPPFLSMASTAMPDIAALTLGLTGIERLLAWKEERRWHQAVVASLTLGLAPYARPHVALLIPLGALWLFDELQIRKLLAQLRRQAYLWTPILIAACILITVHQLTRDGDPADKLTNDKLTNLLVGAENIPGNLYAYLRYLSFPIPFAAVWLAIHWRKAPMLIVLPSIPVFMFHFMRFPSGTPAEWPMAAALCGLAALVHMIYHYRRAWDRLGMLLSLWVLVPVPVIIYTHFPIKYMVIVLPAIVLILIRILSRLPRSRELSAYGALVFACAGFSCVLLRADADFAEYGRRASAELIAPHVAAGEKVWSGGQWGFYWYAQEAGAKISKPGEPGPNPGELLAVGLMESGGVTRDRFPNRELIDSRRYDSPHGRTMGYGGCLYSNRCGGYAPWVWKPEATNVYELWRIH
jgi:4-amino-4-deoxy-L-arabinose transferase-like glycosyltransferase